MYCEVQGLSYFNCFLIQSFAVRKFGTHSLCCLATYVQNDRDTNIEKHVEILPKTPKTITITNFTALEKEDKQQCKIN